MTALAPDLVDDLREHLQKAIEAAGIEKVRSVLYGFGVQRLAQLDPATQTDAFRSAMLHLAAGGKVEDLPQPPPTTTATTTTAPAPMAKAPVQDTTAPISERALILTHEDTPDAVVLLRDVPADEREQLDIEGYVIRDVLRMAVRACVQNLPVVIVAGADRTAAKTLGRSLLSTAKSVHLVDELRRETLLQYLLGFDGDEFDGAPAEVPSPAAGIARLRADAVPVHLPLRVLTLHDVEQAPQVPDVVAGVKPPGAICVTTGATGSGKSFLRYGEAVAVADGVPFLGRPTTRGGVLLLVGEGQAGLRRRLRAAIGAERMADSSDPIHGRLRVLPFLPMLTKRADYDQLVGTLDELAEEPRLLVVDTWSLLLGKCDLDENSTRDTTRMLCKLRLLQERFPQMAIEVLHHPGHRDNRERGSNALPSNADVRVFASKVGTGVTLAATRLDFLKVKDEEATLPPVTVYYQPVPVGDDKTSLRIDRWISAGEVEGEKAPAVNDQDYEAVVAHLLVHERATGKDLAALFSCSQATAYRHLKKWADAGKIGKSGDLFVLAGGSQ